MTILVDYQGDLRCTAAATGSTHVLTTDAPQAIGGKGEYLSPTDLVAVALATCVTTMLGTVAQRSSLELKGMQVRVEKEMTTTGPRRVATIRLTIVMPLGTSISAADRQKLERAAQSCPVKQSLHPDVQVAIEFVYPS